MNDRTKTLEQERFMRFVSPEPNSGCWLWIGAIRGNSHRQPARYGAFWLRGAMIPAHKAAFVLFCSEVPPAVNVLHKCDNTFCVNPSHLFLGDQSSNMLDCVAKGRHHMTARATCKNGHDLSDSKFVRPSGRTGWRRCLKCNDAYARKRRAAIPLPEGEP